MSLNQTISITVNMIKPLFLLMFVETKDRKMCQQITEYNLAFMMSQLVFRFFVVILPDCLYVALNVSDVKVWQHCFF